MVDNNQGLPPVAEQTPLPIGPSNLRIELAQAYMRIDSIRAGIRAERLRLLRVQAEARSRRAAVSVSKRATPPGPDLGKLQGEELVLLDTIAERQDTIDTLRALEDWTQATEPTGEGRR